MDLYIKLTQAWASNPELPAIYFKGLHHSWVEIENSINRIASFIRSKPNKEHGLIEITAQNNWHRFLAILACIHEARLFSTESLGDNHPAFHITIKLNDSDITEISSSSEVLNPIDSYSYPSTESLLRIASTSGTTGSPKWVAISAGSQLGRIEESHTRIGQMNTEANLFICGPSAWFSRFFGAATHGSLLCLDHNVESVVDFLLKYPHSNIYCSPDHLIFLLKETNNINKKIIFGNIIVVGGAINKKIFIEFQKLGGEVFTQYASTECGHTAQSIFQPMDDLKYVLGRPASDIQIKIKSAQGTALRHGMSGNIWVKTPYMANGYIDFSDGKVVNFPDGWFSSGDQGYINDQGQLIYLGRDGDVVNIRGVKVNLQHIDNFFIIHSDIEDAAAFLMPGEMDFPEVWVAVVIKHKINSKNLEDISLKSLGVFMAPTRIIQVRKIPKTITGKIRRQEMSLQIGKILKLSGLENP